MWREYGYGGWPRYVPVRERRRKAEAHAKKLAKRGRVVQPVALAGRAIATTFWGEAWCENLERYSDYENRLPRGRSYVRNGSIIDLQIRPGVVEALVSGSRLYTVTIRIKPLAPARWKKLCGECAGGIESAVELLKGNFSDGVMAIMTDRERGLFPAPKEISISCSCPDHAGLCKHSAAALYGAGARLDHQPELLFRLRRVNEEDLLARAGAVQALTQRGRRGTSRRLDATGLSGVFGIELEPAAAAAPRRRGRQAKQSLAAGKRSAATGPRQRRRQQKPRTA